MGSMDTRLDMQKFVEERLETVPLAKGRKAEEEASLEEREATRAAVGSLTWAAKEGRPDAAAAASLVASALSSLKVQDVMDLNKAIVAVKKRADLSLKIQSIPLSVLQWGVITDASYANASKGRSQGAFAVIAFEEKMVMEGSGKCNLLHWRSGKIQRVVNSTLAAETQSLSRGLSELSWTVTVFNELTTEDFNMKDWEGALHQRRLQAFASEKTEPDLKSICVVDAKSLYDHLSKETIGTASDKRTALEMQVIRQTLAETSTSIKWLPHPKMVVDVLTKRNGNIEPLHHLLDSGVFSLADTKEKTWEL